MRENAFGQPIGPAIGSDFVCPDRPRADAMQGRWCRLEPLTAAHASALFEAFSDDDGRMWTYLSFGPFDSVGALSTQIEAVREGGQWVGFAIVVDGAAWGAAHYMNIDPARGSVEVGAVTFSPKLQRTRAATEAMFLMADRAFAQGYRRYEWKCDALNAPSRRAALRLGFRFEGVHRCATLYKGRSRDTAWFSIIESEWPERRESFERWLDPGNFDHRGQQRSALQRPPPA